MAPLVVLMVSLLLLRGVGRLGISSLDSWRDATRVGLAVMFIFTGASHFAPMQHDLAAMIPPPLPKDLRLIYFTGVLEIAGAIGLLIPRVQRLAAVCLMMLLVALFPANVYAALNDVPLRGNAPTPLWLRTPEQLLFIGALWWSSVAARRATAAAPISEGARL